MNTFSIVTDSSCDLPAPMAQEMDLTVLPLAFVMQGKEYYNYLDEREIPLHTFYEALRAGQPCTTSAVNVEAFTSAMEPLLAAGKDVLCIAFSSGLSNTYNAAAVAVQELSQKYPERKIYASIPSAPLWARACWSILPHRNALKERALKRCAIGWKPKNFTSAIGSLWKTCNFSSAVGAFRPQPPWSVRC